MPNSEDIGFLGLGQMGGSMAERLLGQPYRLHVYDPVQATVQRFVEHGAIAHTSATSVADSASIVFACLPGTDISLDAAFGPNGVIHGRAIRIYVEMSTIGTQTIEKIAAALRDRNIETLDAPVTGGPWAARAGTLAMILAGAPAAQEIVRPLLARIGRDIFVMGEKPGMAQVMKLVNNLLLATNVAACAEGLVMGAKAGLDADRMMQLINAGSGGSTASAQVLSNAVRGQFNLGAALSILDKDVTLGTQEASHLSVRLPIIEEARRVWHEAYEAGFGDQDFTAILKAIEQANGVTVRGSAA